MYHLCKHITIECMISKTDPVHIVEGFMFSRISGKFTCISFSNMYLYMFSFVSTSLKFGLRMYRCNDTSYSYNNINQPGKILPVGNN